MVCVKHPGLFSNSASDRNNKPHLRPDEWESLGNTGNNFA